MIFEKDFLQSVRELARNCGWATYHTHRSDRSEPGFPDLVLCRPPRVVFAELKNETGRVSDYQQYWLDNLRRCEGVDVFLWRPSDWDSIVRCLDCGARLPQPRRDEA